MGWGSVGNRMAVIDGEWGLVCHQILGMGTKIVDKILNGHGVENMSLEKNRDGK